MRPVVFLGNAASPHVRHWSVFLTRAGIPHAVAGIHAGNLLQGVPVRHHFRWLHRLGRAGDYLGYVLLGLLCRLRYRGGRDGVLLHAHNTSGYGLAALLSGCPYIVTTYGSEIYAAAARGRLYRCLIGAVLRRALLVTASTARMHDELVRGFGLPEERIVTFSLGVDPLFFPDAAARARLRAAHGIGQEEPVWISNRRITPLYHTLELVRAFRRYRADGGRGRLILLEGSSDPAYLARVLAEAAAVPEVLFVPGFLAQDRLRSLLSAADFAISVPDTDQLSSSILESIACGCIPVLLDNPAYAPVLRTGQAVVVAAPTEAALYQAFQLSARRALAVPAERPGRLAELLGDDFSSDGVCRKIAGLYAQAQALAACSPQTGRAAPGPDDDR